MTRSERAASGFQLAPGSKVGIIAGGGSLPVEVADGLVRHGFAPFVIIAAGEVDREADFAAYEQEKLALEDIGLLFPLLKRRGITHLVLAGEIKRRPRLSKIRPALGLLAIIPSVVRALRRGDDGLLRMLTRALEKRGVRVVGAHEVVPELTAGEGPLTVAEPNQSDWRDIQAARQAAKAIGALDIGQASIAIGGRTVALEGIEGTAGLLDRMRELRGHGRLAGKTRGVLVKCAKPGQELRADLPTIGPQTVEAAHAAGLAGIAVEAGRSLILEGPTTLARANALGLFIVGLPSTERASGEPADGR
ncbi:MAG: UDP-2,3-diacylglucosamine diphosphatase LpxI [Alphaproteobacteria bacterium]|nr:UDP-2,3-diacylglucosamine diphosphatase LpxI [Alphaproteobacteria bacterium]